MVGTLVLVGCALLSQAETPDAKLIAQVKSLITQLDGPLSVRRQAEKKLLAIGPKALDVLTEALRQSSAKIRRSPQVKERLKHIRHTLELQHAKSAGKASLVTLQGDAMPLSEAIAAIEKQTGNKIVDLRREEGRDDPKLKLSFDRVPFWKALDAVVDQAKLGIDLHSDDLSDDTSRAIGIDTSRAIGIVERFPGMKPRSGAAVYSGPYRIEVVSVQSRRDLRFAAGDGLRLNLEVAWEPRIAPFELTQRASDVKATDENGKLLTIGNDAAQFGGAIQSGQQSVELVIPFQLPSRDVKTIASVKGKLDVLMPGHIEQFRFDNLTGAKRIEKRRGDVTVILDHAGKNNNLSQVRMRVFYDQPGDALQSHFGWIYENRAYLEGPDKKPITDVSFESDRIERGIAAAYYFDVAGGLEGHTFVYETPAVLLRLPFEFELKDLPLP